MRPFSGGRRLDRPGAARRVARWCALWGLLATGASIGRGQTPAPAGSPQAGSPQAGSPQAETNAAPSATQFEALTRGAAHEAGLIDLYRFESRVYARLGSAHWDQPLLAFTSIAAGAAAAGNSFPYGEQWIVAFRRVGDRVQVLRKNLRYEAPAGTPLEKAVRLNYLDSVLMTLPIACHDAPGGDVLIDLSDVFLGNFAKLPSRDFDRNRSRWKSARAYPDNVELQVEATFGSHPLQKPLDASGESGYVDENSATVVLHYSLLRLPDEGYRPRLADPRLGHFVAVTRDFGTSDRDTTFVRRIQRWRLEKAAPALPLSPPREQIVWWIENTVPYEYVPAVEAGILEWNKAFARIGFQDALAVRRQTEQDDFAPEDARYCTFRWTATPQTTAISNVRCNPLTGEILDGDILFDASWVRFWDQQQAVARLPNPAGNRPEDVRIGEIVSPLLAAEHALRTAPASSSQAQCACCQVGSLMRAQVPLALAAVRLQPPPGGPSDEQADVLVQQLVKNVVLHEVGHSLGLRHNFRGSAGRRSDRLHDREFTAANGLSASVMDYAPINLALPGQPQGDYAPITLGAYDYWAVAYAYGEFAGDERQALRELAAQSIQSELQYAGDEDASASYDPQVNWYDLGDDVLQFAVQRMDLADAVLASLADNWVAEGESWTRLRGVLLSAWQQYGDAAVLIVRHVGGRRVSRDARGDGARLPILPESADRQREALRIAVDRLLCDEPISASPDLLRRAATPLWTHWGFNADDYEGKVGLPYYDYVYALQHLVLYELLGNGERLRRMETNEALVDGEEEPLRIAELFATLNAGVWNATWLPAADGEAPRQLPKTRRNLQRLHVACLLDMVRGRDAVAAVQPAYADVRKWAHPFPGEARSLARQQLKQLRVALRSAGQTQRWDDVSAAHLQELADLIDGSLKDGADGVP